MFKLLIFMTLVVFCYSRHMVLGPICGSDGNTYESMGHLIMYNADYGAAVYKMHEGPCRPTFY